MSRDLRFKRPTGVDKIYADVNGYDFTEVALITITWPNRPCHDEFSLNDEK